MTEEIWRDIKNYEGRYQVSDQGRVKSLERTFIDKNGRKQIIKERVLRSGISRGGYLRVRLYAYGKSKTLSVHRLVCETFHKNPDNKSQVNHINEIKTDNRACNLEWSTACENINFGTRSERVAKALSKKIGQYALDGQLVKIWQSAVEARRQTGFSRSAISEVANGNRKTHGGFIWKYIS